MNATFAYVLGIVILIIGIGLSVADRKSVV